MRSFYNNTSSSEKSNFFLGGSTLEKMQKASKGLAVENKSGLKKNGNELGKTLTKLRVQRAKVENLLCASTWFLIQSIIE